MVVREIFGSKMDEGTRGLEKMWWLGRYLGLRWTRERGDWRKLHNEELHDLHFSPNVTRVIKSSRMGWVGHVANVRESGSSHRVLVIEPEGRRPLERPRCRWVGL